MKTISNIAKECSDMADSHSERHLYTIGRWHSALGWMRHLILVTEGEVDGVESENVSVEMVVHLRDIATGAAVILRGLGVDDPAAAFLAEYERAAGKHPGMTLDSDQHTDESRYYALAEEVGEVCAALTYDNKAATGHNADLVSEVTQVGGLAIAWIMRFNKEDSWSSCSQQPC